MASHRWTKRDNMLRQAIGLTPCLAKYVRRGTDLDTYYQVNGWKDEHQFKAGSVCHLRVADINQEIYGLPEWLPALQSALLNESATLFRRKYYQNGSHAGFIMYMTDAAQNEDFVNDLRTAMKNSKGPGNFRNLFMYAPGGKKDGLQLIPISEVAAKDDFGAIKNISRDDQHPASVDGGGAADRWWFWVYSRRGPGMGGQRAGAGAGQAVADQ